MALDRWEQAYIGHPAWQTLAAVKLALERGPERTDGGQVVEYDRLVFVVGYLEEQRESPSLLVSQVALNELSNALANVQTHLDQWASGAGTTSLTNADQYVDAVLAALRGWPPAKDRLAKGTMAAARALQAEANDQLGRIRASVQELTDSLGRMSTEATTSQTEAQQQLQNLTAAIDAQKLRLDSAIEGMQATFLEGERERAATAQASGRQQERPRERPCSKPERLSRKGERLLRPPRSRRSPISKISLSRRGIS